MMKHTTIETIKKGNMQFNVKEAKDFRTIMAKWHDADFDLAEKILEKNDKVKAVRTLIDSDLRLIEKLENGEKIIGTKTVKDFKAEIATWETKIEAEHKALTEYRKAQATRYEAAHNLLSKELHKAYVDYIIDGKREDYILALANFFEANGLVPTMASLEEFVQAVGKRRNGVRAKIKTGQHNGAVAYGQWRDIFLGEICDVMGDALPLYKFTYVLKEERQGKNK